MNCYRVFYTVNDEVRDPVEVLAKNEEDALFVAGASVTIERGEYPHLPGVHVLMVSRLRRATVTRRSATGPPTFRHVEKFLPENYHIVDRPVGKIVIGGEDGPAGTLDKIITAMRDAGITVAETEASA